MKNNTILSLAFIISMHLGLVACSADNAGPLPADTPIKLEGGSCVMVELNGRPMFAPADMKDTEKAVLIKFKYTFSDADKTDAPRQYLYKNAFLKDGKGNKHKAGVMAVDAPKQIWTMIFAIPKEIEVPELVLSIETKDIKLPEAK